jgi:hypothetical protein
LEQIPKPVNQDEGGSAWLFASGDHRLCTQHNQKYSHGA